MSLAIPVASGVIGLILFLLLGVWSFIALRIYRTARYIREAETILERIDQWEENNLKDSSSKSSKKKRSKKSKTRHHHHQKSSHSGKSTDDSSRKSASGSGKSFLMRRKANKSKEMWYTVEEQVETNDSKSDKKKPHIHHKKSSPSSKSEKADLSHLKNSDRSASSKEYSISNEILKKSDTEPLWIKGENNAIERPTIPHDNFAAAAEKIADFLDDYLSQDGSTPVSSAALPGFLVQNMPTHAPATGGDLEGVLSDLNQMLVPKMTHWQHPHYLGPQTLSRSVADILAEMVISHLGSPGFIYDASPAVAEMDVAMLNWAGRALGIPEKFLFHANSETSEGGGSLQESVGDSTLCALMAARWTVTNRLLLDQKKIDPGECYLFSEKTKDDLELHHNEYTKLCVYASSEAHSSVEKNCRLAMLRHRSIEALPQNGYGITAAQVQEKIEKDMAHGLVPCCIVVTLGTKGILANDQLEKLGRLAGQYGIWLHVDASNVSPFWIDYNYRPSPSALMSASSILCKLPFHSANMVVVWTRFQQSWKSGFKVAAEYLKPTKSFALDVRDWTIHLNRRFRSLKLWFAYRLMGLKNMRSRLENLILMTERLERQLLYHENVRIFGSRVLNSFCFQYYEKGIKMSDVNRYTHLLGLYLNESNRFFVKILEIGGSVVLCACVTFEGTTYLTIDSLYKELDQKIITFSENKHDPTLVRNHPPPSSEPVVTAVTSMSSMATRSMTLLRKIKERGL